MVFAEAVGRRPVWEKALEGFNVIESEIVKEWKSQARAAGEREGSRGSKVDWVLRVMNNRSWTVPEDVASSVRACEDLAQLDRWFDTAMSAPSLEAFRQQAGL